MTEHESLPEAFGERSATWHLDKITEFTKFKGEIGEPSPHLALVGYMAKGQPIEEVVWRLGCYAAVYSLPVAQVIWETWPWPTALGHRDEIEAWITKHKGSIIRGTRRERRCVRTPPKLARCLDSYATWTENEYPKLPHLQANSSEEYYNAVWKSVTSVYSIGRYIGIRLIEGLRRYANVPAALHDVRSMGGWSPKKALCYLYPNDYELLLTDNKAGNDRADALAADLLDKMKEALPNIDYYVLAAMLCEYRAAYENKHQYVGWTIDQEPLLYDTVKEYFGNDIDLAPLWAARKAIFPAEVLGELSGWHGTRWPLTKTLRLHDYNWSDLYYDFSKTSDLSKPIGRVS